MRTDVTSLGELLIDLVPMRADARTVYLPKPGGAPGNVAAGLARLGHAAAMIGKVGADAFGETVVAALKGVGVATDAVIRDTAHNTPLAVVSLNERGESDFFFYREGCADSNITPQDIPGELIAQSRILHVGTLIMSAGVSAEGQRHAMTLAREKGVRVSLDTNFRLLFWRDQERMRAAGLDAIKSANIVKASADELTLLTGSKDTEPGVRSLWHPDLIAFAVTKGSGGADLFTAERAVSVPGFSVKVVDTVGCGDAFMASLLSGLLDHDFALEADALATVATRACAAGAIVATRAGALESMPDRKAIDSFLAGR